MTIVETSKVQSLPLNLWGHMPVTWSSLKGENLQTCTSGSNIVFQLAAIVIIIIIIFFVVVFFFHTLPTEQV